MEQYYYKKRTEKFLKTYAEKFSKKSRLTAKDLEHLFSAIIQNFEIPLPNIELRKYFLTKEIISDLFFQIFNSNYLDPDDRKKFNGYFDTIYNLIQFKRGNHFYQFRVLGELGLYPSDDFKRTKSEFTILNQKPTILTYNNYEVENLYSNDSMISWITRNELKFNSSIICSIESGWGFLFFEGANSISLDETTLNQVPKQLRKYFFYEALLLLKSSKSPGESYFTKRVSNLNPSYNYMDFSKYLRNFENVYDNFSIRNHLLLRTTNHLSKALMLDRNGFYKEEAVTNIFICLEGCLHLLQKKWGDQKPQLNLKLLEEKFTSELNDPNTFEFIKEAYHKRISLIHPEPKWGSQWTPYIDFHDFFDYFKICRYLLHYYFTNNPWASW
jgi:hypothetical protein